MTAGVFFRSEIEDRKKDRENDCGAGKTMQ